MADRLVHITLVGHCGPDVAMIRSALRRVFRETRIENVGSVAELETAIGHSDLLLVNRVLDGDFPMELGGDLIAQFRADRSEPAIMLVSNYPDAQAEAVAAGAAPGFGKGDMYSDETRHKLLSAVGLTANSA